MLVAVDMASGVDLSLSLLTEQERSNQVDLNIEKPA